MIDKLHAMMKQLLENTNKKKSSRQGPKKHTPNPSEISEEEEDALHVEIASEHSECSDSSEAVSQ